MKLIAVISEYNPFHRGHAYQIGCLRKEFGEDAVLLSILSGPLTERGDLPIVGKYARAEMALSAGVDIVVELPAPWCFAGAAFFARGGVAIAEALHTDVLAFGSESGDLSELLQVKNNLGSSLFEKALAEEREKKPAEQTGTLRRTVYESLFGKTDVLSGSNDLLVLSYLAALEKTKIEPFAVRRLGHTYNQKEADGIASATAIREAISGHKPFLHLLPPDAGTILARELSAGKVRRFSHLDTAILSHFRLSGPPQKLTMEMSEAMANRLHELSFSATDAESLIESATERRYSPSRVRRAILASLLGFTMSDAEETPAYTQLLGASGRGRKYLAMLRDERLPFPILTKPADHRMLSEDAASQFEKNYAAEALSVLGCDKKENSAADAVLRGMPVFVD